MLAFRFAAVAVAVTALGPPAHAQAASRPDSINAGRVELAVHGLGGRIGGGARVRLTERYALALEVDRTAFTSGDPSTNLPPFRNGGGNALTVSMGLGSAVSLGYNWLRLGVDYQVYYQRQEDVVALAYDDSFVPVYADDLRHTDGAGVAVAYRIEANVLGPVQVGYATGGLGLGVRRTRGGTVETNRFGPRGVEPRQETSVRLGTGGSTPRFYLSVRL